MSTLATARLQELNADDTTTGRPDPWNVQFNPASLTVVINNDIVGGRKPTGPSEPHTGGSSTLSLDLHFDTADEGTTDAAVDVRKHTEEVIRFVVPRKDGDATQSPPRVRLEWGSFSFSGTMTQVTETLDLFSASGVPLRAKLAVAISGQDKRYESTSGPASATAAGSSAPGAGGLSIGGGVGLGASASFGASIGGGASLQLGASAGIALGASASLGTPSIGVALDGESPAGFAARVGLDPAAWRALAAPGGLQPALAAGTEVAFSRGASTAPGVGFASGRAEAGPGAALERLDGPAAPLPGAREAVASGFALARAGGVDAALQTVHQERADVASAHELGAFGMAAPASAAATGAPRRALHAQPGTGAPGAAAPASAPPRADDRATTYGLGVPLRPRRGAGRADASTPVALGRRAPAVAPAPSLPKLHGGDCGCGCGGSS